METIMNNDTNVPHVEGLFSNDNAKGKICYFICLLFFFYDSEPFSFKEGNKRQKALIAFCQLHTEAWRLKTYCHFKQPINLTSTFNSAGIESVKGKPINTQTQIKLAHIAGTWYLHLASADISYTSLMPRLTSLH